MFGCNAMVTLDNLPEANVGGAMVVKDEVITTTRVAVVFYLSHQLSHQSFHVIQPRVTIAGPLPQCRVGMSKYM